MRRAIEDLANELAEVYNFEFADGSLLQWEDMSENQRLAWVKVAERAIREIQE